VTRASVRVSLAIRPFAHRSARRQGTLTSRRSTIVTTAITGSRRFQPFTTVRNVSTLPAISSTGATIASM